ncbi:MAG: hypothetical protein ACYC40_03925 [Patescibacteria group bacterium]
MYLNETNSNRNRTNFVLTDDEGILCQSVDINDIAEHIVENNPEVAEELTHQYEIAGKFTGSEDLFLSISGENMEKFLKSLSTLFYADSFVEALGDE